MSSFAEFEKLLRVRREGHSRVPSGHVETVEGEPHKLGSWTASCRSAFSRGSITAERIARLENFPDWQWDLVDAIFEEGIRSLTQFAQRTGHTRVPAKHFAWPKILESEYAWALRLEASGFTFIPSNKKKSKR